MATAGIVVETPDGIVVRFEGCDVEPAGDDPSHGYLINPAQSQPLRAQLLVDSITQKTLVVGDEITLTQPIVGRDELKLKAPLVVYVPRGTFHLAQPVTIEIGAAALPEKPT